MAANLEYSIIPVSTPEKTIVVALQGEIDESNQQKLIDLLEGILLGGLEKIEKTTLERQSFNFSLVNNIVFNIKNLEYINSGVIGIFASYHSQFIDAGKEFVFAEANEHIFDIIDLVGLTTVITLFPTNSEACISFED